MWGQRQTRKNRVVPVKLDSSSFTLPFAGLLRKITFSSSYRFVSRVTSLISLAFNWFHQDFRSFCRGCSATGSGMFPSTIVELQPQGPQLVPTHSESASWSASCHSKGVTSIEYILSRPRLEALTFLVPPLCWSASTTLPTTGKPLLGGTLARSSDADSTETGSIPMGSIPVCEWQPTSNFN